MNYIIYSYICLLLKGISFSLYTEIKEKVKFPIMKKKLVEKYEHSIFVVLFLGHL